MKLFFHGVTLSGVRFGLVLVGLALSMNFMVAAEGEEAPTQTGKFSSVRLLPVSRVRVKEGPTDGLTFHFLVMRPPGVAPLALRETRDFMLDSASYQAKTKAELGKLFEPHTVVNDADRFFAQRTDFARFVPKDRTAAKVISVSIAGAALVSKAEVEVTLTVGTGREVEPFTFKLLVPEK